MGFHTFDPAETDRLEDPTRFRFCSREELLQWLPTDDDATILDIGSGTGFYTDELAPFVGQILALDLQPAMHAQYADRGIPANVDPLTADAGALPLDTNSVDGSVSTMTFHESTTSESIAELARVLAPDSPAVIVDWTADGRGESGPPVSERYDLDDARGFLTEAGFDIEHAKTRSETFALVGRA